MLQIIDGYLAQKGDALRIVNDLSKGMEAVGEPYKNDEYALAELVCTGEIFKEAMRRVKPRLAAGGDAYRGACIMGMVRVPMPALERPWWKRELGWMEKSWNRSRDGHHAHSLEKGNHVISSGMAWLPLYFTGYWGD